MAPSSLCSGQHLSLGCSPELKQRGQQTARTGAPPGPSPPATKTCVPFHQNGISKASVRAWSESDEQRRPFPGARVLTAFITTTRSQSSDLGPGTALNLQSHVFSCHNHPVKRQQSNGYPLRCTEEALSGTPTNPQLLGPAVAFQAAAGCDAGGQTGDQRWQGTLGCSPRHSK